MNSKITNVLRRTLKNVLFQHFDFQYVRLNANKIQCKAKYAIWNTFLADFIVHTKSLKD